MEHRHRNISSDDHRSHALLVLIGQHSNATASRVDASPQPVQYYLASNPENICNTPFIAEALIKLLPGKFTHLYILGTTEAMWTQLFEHCLQKTDLKDDEYWIETYTQFQERIQQKKMQPMDAALLWLARALEHFLGIKKVECHLIETGTQASEIWQIFQTLMKLNIPEGTISIDITHSLRHHPFFLFLTLLYYQALFKEVEIDSIYYGAFELQNEGKTPIFNLKEMLEMFRWILAVYSFMNYGDIRPILALLPHEISTSSITHFEHVTRQFSLYLQTNLLGKMRDFSRDLISAYAEAATDPLFPRPLLFLKKQFLQLARELEEHGSSKWKATLKIAQYHWDHNRPGLSILALWEAIIDRVGELYNLNPDTMDGYQKIGEMIKSAQIQPDFPEELQEFIQQLQQIRQMRNLVAHADERSYRDEDIETFLAQYPAILEKCEYLLQHEQLTYAFRLD